MSDWHSPGQLRVREALPQALEPEDSVGDDGSSGLWLRTWRRTRPAPSAASSAPASSRGSGSDAQAHPRPLPRPPGTRPPVSRTALPSQQPPAGCLRTCARAAPLRPAPAPWPPGYLRGNPWPACARALSRRGGPPAPFPPPSNQIGRGERSPGNALAAGLRVQALAPRLSEAFVQLRVTVGRN